MTAGDTVNESTGVRELRSAIKQLLDEGENHKFLNTLSYAELSKLLYFMEGKSDPTIMEGIQLLRASLQSLGKPSDKGPLLLKMGELYLAKQDYPGAIQALDGAVTALGSSPSKARALASWSTSLAAQGEWQRAIDKYRGAEKLYPEGHREIFYSNLAYMLCQRATQFRRSGETADAESCLGEAEGLAKKALSIKRDDWISVLNLALIQDELRKFAEAELNYKLVVGNAARSDIVSEAWILYGRSLHLGERPLSEVVKALLQGLGRASDDQTVNSYHSEQEKTKELFAASAEALKQMPPHGLERYINWFIETGNSL